MTNVALVSRLTVTATNEIGAQVDFIGWAGDWLPGVVVRGLDTIGTLGVRCDRTGEIFGCLRVRPRVALTRSDPGGPDGARHFGASRRDAAGETKMTKIVAGIEAKRTIADIMGELRRAVADAIESGERVDADVATVALAIFSVPVQSRMDVTARAIRHLIDHNRFGYGGKSQ